MLRAVLSHVSQHHQEAIKRELKPGTEEQHPESNSPPETGLAVDVTRALTINDFFRLLVASWPQPQICPASCPHILKHNLVPPIFGPTKPPLLNLSTTGYPEPYLQLPVGCLIIHKPATLGCAEAKACTVIVFFLKHKLFAIY